MTHIVAKIFGNRSAKHEAQAAQYTAITVVDTNLRRASLFHFKDPHATFQSSVRKSWNKMRLLFTGENPDLTDIQKLINVDSMVASFAIESQILDKPTVGTSISSCEYLKGILLVIATTHNVNSTEPVAEKSMEKESAFVASVATAGAVPPVEDFYHH